MIYLCIRNLHAHHSRIEVGELGRWMFQVEFLDQFNMIGKEKSSPKYKFFAQVHEKVNTERSYQENCLMCLPSCRIMCGREDETINHLFFRCNSASLFEYIFERQLKSCWALLAYCDALSNENLFIFEKATTLQT